MQGTNVDLVMLALLILFFGLQQRSHPKTYFRFWFIGWILVFLGYGVWAAGVAHSPLLVNLQAAACFDFVLLGILTFMMSLLPTGPLLRKMLLAGSVIGLPSVVVIDLTELHNVPKLLLGFVVVLWHLQSFCIAYLVLPRDWIRRRAMILGICAVYGSGLLVYALTTRADNLDAGAVVEVLLCTAALYAGSAVRENAAGLLGRRSVVGWMGTLGFGLWAIFYLVNLWVLNQPLEKLLYDFWNFPKYFVGFSMILKVFEDATDEKEKMARKFRNLYDDFRLIYETHPHPMWICDSNGGEFLTANEAMLNEYGYSMEELLSMRMWELELPTSHDVDAGDTLTAAEGAHLQHRHKDGRVVWVSMLVREIVYMGHEARFVIARDVTERLKLNQELSFRAQHDVLTGLPNRQLMNDRLAQALKTSEREGKRATLLSIDVDHFKRVNDTYGHLLGDECLKAVAARLQAKIRKVDTIARTGGEEFTAIVGSLSNPQDSEKVAESLLRAFETPMDLSIGTLMVTVSIGVAVYPDDAADAESLRQRSDDALYRAKRSGRNRAAYACDAVRTVDTVSTVELEAVDQLR